jgi:hypothetical protein
MIYAQTQTAPLPECSSEKVNPDCKLTIDRLNPVTAPTIQLRPGKAITIVVTNPLQFETLTLDAQSAQAIAGADQTQALLNQLIPTLKGFVGEQQINFAPPPPLASAPNNVPASQDVIKKTADNDVKKLNAMLAQGMKDLNGATTAVRAVYAQLQQVLGSVPRPAGGLPPQGLPAKTPDPWQKFEDWRKVMLCELNGSNCPASPSSADAAPTFKDLLDTLQNLDLPKSANGEVAWSGFETIVSDLRVQIALLGDAGKDYKAQLDGILNQENALAQAASPLLALEQTIQKDLTTYAQNIAMVGAPVIGPLSLGAVYDPACPPKASSSHTDKTCPKTRLLGIQSAFVLNAVNQISTLSVSVPTAQQKKAVTTITVLYADPRFEVSTGIFLSTLPNRSFSNVTQVNQGTTLTEGNVVIAQTLQRPTIIPYAAGNWRIGNDGLWPGGRRMAWYLTAGAGINPYNTTAEFAFGLSVSWRNLMISPLFHLGHDVELTQGESVGEVWCNQSAKNCPSSIPSPSTQKYWTGAFGLGIGIRVPTSFGNTAGK